jgi:hypothetical protein
MLLFSCISIHNTLTFGKLFEWRNPSGYAALHSFDFSLPALPVPTLRCACFSPFPQTIRLSTFSVPCNHAGASNQVAQTPTGAARYRWDLWVLNYCPMTGRLHADLAPAQAMGIDAVWMPPPSARPDSGYSPADNYDGRQEQGFLAEDPRGQQGTELLARRAGYSAPTASTWWDASSSEHCDGAGSSTAQAAGTGVPSFDFQQRYKKLPLRELRQRARTAIFWPRRTPPGLCDLTSQQQLHQRRPEPDL